MMLLAAATIYVLTYVTPDGDLRQKDYADMESCGRAMTAIWAASGRDDRVLSRMSCNPATSFTPEQHEGRRSRGMPGLQTDGKALGGGSAVGGGGGARR